MNKEGEDAARAARRENRTERWTSTAAIIIAAAVALAYILAHGNLPFGGPSAWGEFGDYFAGVVNPIIGLLTLWLLLQTLKITRQVRDDTKAMMDDQRKALADQERAMADQLVLLRAEAEDRTKGARLTMIEGRLNAALEAWSSISSTTNILADQGTTPFILQDVWNSTTSWENFVWIIKNKVGGDERAWKKGVRDVLYNACPEVRTLIFEFNNYCVQYEGAGGDRLVTDFYRSRLAPAMRRLDEVEYVQENLARYLQAPIYASFDPAYAEPTGSSELEGDRQQP